MFVCACDCKSLDHVERLSDENQQTDKMYIRVLSAMRMFTLARAHQYKHTFLGNVRYSEWTYYKRDQKKVQTKMMLTNTSHFTYQHENRELVIRLNSFKICNILSTTMIRCAKYFQYTEIVKLMSVLTLAKTQIHAHSYWTNVFTESIWRSIPH